MSEPINPYASPRADLAPPPGAPWVEDVSPSLRQTALGLSMVYYGIVFMLVSVLVVPFGGALAAGVGAIWIAFVAAGIGLVLGTILMFAGHLVCLAVPAESGAKGLIVASVLFQLANIVCAVGHQFVPVEISAAAYVVLSVLGLVGTLLFVLFMKKLAEYIGRPDLAARARNILVGAAVLVALALAMIGAAVSESFPAAAPALGEAALVAGLIVFVMYANLVDSLRKALRVVKSGAR